MLLKRWQKMLFVFMIIKCLSDSTNITSLLHPAAKFCFDTCLANLNIFPRLFCGFFVITHYLVATWFILLHRRCIVQNYDFLEKMLQFKPHKYYVGTPNSYNLQLFSYQFSFYMKGCNFCQHLRQLINLPCCDK